MRWRRLAASVLAMGIVGGCAGEEASPPHSDPTIPTLPPDAVTTVPTDLYAIPAVIDEAYINSVLAALDQAVGDALRLVVRSRAITQEVGDRLNEVYSNPVFVQTTLDGFQRLVDTGFSTLLNQPGDKRTTVERVLSQSEECVFAQVHRDHSALTPSPDPRLGTQWVAIRLSLDRSQYNPTGWTYEYDGFERGFLAPANPCAP